MNKKDEKKYIELLTQIHEFEVNVLINLHNTVIVNSITRSTKSIKKQLENFFTTD